MSIIIVKRGVQGLKGDKGDTGSSFICLGPFYLTTPDGPPIVADNILQYLIRKKFQPTGVYAAVKTRPNGSALKLSVKKNGSTILTAANCTIDVATLDSSLSVVPTVLLPSIVYLPGDFMSFGVVQKDSGNIAAGLELNVCGTYLDT